MSDTSVVLIAARERLEPLKQRVSPVGDVLELTDLDVQRAVEILTTQKPSLFVLERFFAATPRGAALIKRLRADPNLVNVEIRVVAHDSDYSHVVAHRASAIAANAPGDQPIVQSPPIDQGGTRQAIRVAAPEEVEVLVDGKPVALVDLANGGAQVVSPTVLRPNQRVRVSIGWQQEVARVGATIAWASYEMGKESGRPQYRAGLTFNPGEDDAIEALAEKWQD